MGPRIGAVGNPCNCWKKYLRALSSAWKSTWFATKGPGVQIPQRPPLHYSAVSWFSIFSRPLRVTSLMPETLQTSLWVLGEELSWDAL